MIIRYFAAGLLLALSFTGLAWAETAPAINLTTAAGKPVKLRNHVKLDNSCTGSQPDISFSQNPAHGTVDIRPDRFVFGKGYVSGELKACEGKQVDGVAIWYTPAAGFHGTDQISWTANFGGRGKRVDNYTAIVTVQ
jgi:hypothetical protein